MLCHMENIAPGTVAIASVEKDVLARLVARPEFCIPISIERAFVFDKLSFNAFPKQKPKIYPKILCKKTTIKTTKLVVRIFDELCDTTEATIMHIPITETRGRLFTAFFVNLPKNLLIRNMMLMMFM